MAKRIAVVAALALALSATPALADIAPLSIQRGLDWKHRETKLVIPGEVAGLVMTDGSDFGQTQSDLLFQYHSDDRKTHATLFFFRAGLPDVSIWADRVRVAMFAQNYGKFDVAGRRWTLFTPSTGGKNSGIRFTYPLSGREFTATGSAFEQRGDWMVAVRITSSALDAANLDDLLARFMTDLAFDPSGAEPGAAYEMTDCATRLPKSNARQIKEDVPGESALVPLVMQVEKSTEKPSEAKPFCREPGTEGGSYSVYRAGGSTDAYTIAFGDAGAVLQVAPWPLEQEGKKRYSVIMYTNDVLFGFPNFDGLPAISDAIKATNGNPIFGQRRLPGYENKIEIFVPQK